MKPHGREHRKTVSGFMARRRRAVALGASAAAIGWLAVLPAIGQDTGQNPGLTFRTQEIAANFGVGYAVTPGDVNGDGRVDVLAISGTELAWFENPTWQKHTILGPGATEEDNVAIAPHDVDGDGRLDVAIAAGWGGRDTGTLQWARQGEPGTPWQVYPIHAEPTMHRIGWADVDGDGRKELVGAPLRGADERPGARLLVFTIPADPRTDSWPMEVADDRNNIMHNFTVVRLPADDTRDAIVTASREGLFAIRRDADGTWTRTRIGEGAPGEVKLGVVEGRRLLATVEPWHGAGVAIYAEEPQGLWAKTMIESELTEGHALGWGDLDGDGQDELAVGWRSGPGAGLAVYAVGRDGALAGKQSVEVGVTRPSPAGEGRRGGRGGGRGSSRPPAQGMDTEDLTVVDLNGDNRPEIVASGRATRNVKIYWNETE
jgi:hypothetical protein